MEPLSVLFPPAFPALALAHFVALLSPGPDFFLLVATPFAIDCAVASGCAWGSPPVTGSISCWRLLAGGSSVSILCSSR